MILTSSTDPERSARSRFAQQRLACARLQRLKLAILKLMYRRSKRERSAPLKFKPWQRNSDLVGVASRNRTNSFRDIGEWSSGGCEFFIATSRCSISESIPKNLASSSTPITIKVIQLWQKSIHFSFYSLLYVKSSQ